MTTLFTGGSVFDGHRHLPGHGAARRGRERSSAVLGRSVTLETLDRARPTRSSTWPAAWSRPGFTDAHCHPIQGGLERMQCDLTERSARARSTSPTIRAYADAAPTGRGSSAAAGRWRRSRAARRRRPTSTPSCPTGRCSCPTATTTAPGSTRRALELAGITAETPDPPDGRIERLPDGSPQGTLHEGAMDLVGRLLPDAPPAEYAAGLLEGQRYLYSLGVTAWQDAIVGAYAGMDDTGLDVPATRSRAATWSPTSSARSGGTASSALDQVADLVERRRAQSGGRVPRRPASRSCRTASARTSRPRCCTPYLDGHAARHGSSCSVPDGRPSASRSIRPSGGSGVLAVDARRSPAPGVLTQAPWWSRLGRNTGRSGTTASRSAAVGVPPGNAGIAQPPPRIHSRVGVRGRRTRGPSARYSSRVDELGQVAAQPLQAALDRVHVGVGEAGATQAAGQVDDVEVGARAPLEPPGPTSTTRPPSTRTSPRPRYRWPSKTVAAGEEGGHQRPSSSGPAGSWVMPTFFAASPDSASRQTRLARNAVISAWS